jgi:hypothetical protein
VILFFVFIFLFYSVFDKIEGSIFKISLNFFIYEFKYWNAKMFYGFEY